MFKKIIISLVLVLSILPAISQDEDAIESSEGLEVSENSESSSWKQVQMPFTYQNVQVPRELWQTIKDVLKQDGVKQKIIDDFVVLPVGVGVELFSEDHRVLKDSLNYQIRYIEGGGKLDLFDFVVGKGSFNIRFAPELNSDGDFHLLYISDSPGKDMEGDQWGNGCGVIYDLTDKQDLFVLDGGMRVTSSQRHYLHLMAGTFVFFQLVDERLYLGYIRIEDSRYPNFKCRVD